MPRARRCLKPRPMSQHGPLKMLVKTPAMKLGVEIREMAATDGRLVMKGVANAMPCTVEMGGPEIRQLAAMVFHPKRIFSVVGLMLSKKT